MTRRLSGPIPALGRLALVGQLAGALAFVAVLLHAEGLALPLIDSPQWTLSAGFADADGLHSGERTPVLVAGVPSGWVTGVRVDRGVAVVTMRLNSSTRGVIHRDATARIEPRSALQDLTVDISPGSPSAPAVSPGIRIATADTAGTTNLDEVLSVLDADTRAELSILLGAVAHGLRGHGGALRGAVARLSGLLSPATQLARALARRRELLTGLVSALSHIGAAAAAHDLAVARALSAGERTLSAAASREQSLSASVSALPSTVRTLDVALERVRELARPLAPTLSRLRRAADALPVALASVRRVTPAVGSLLSAGASFTDTGAPGIHAAAELLAHLDATAAALTPPIAELRPIVSAVNSRRQGIGLLGERFSGVLSTDDANGPVLRGLGAFEPFDPADFGYPNATGAQKAALAARAASALTLMCLRGGLVACLVRYLVSGLPGSVR